MLAVAGGDADVDESGFGFFAQPDDDVEVQAGDERAGFALKRHAVCVANKLCDIILIGPRRGNGNLIGRFGDGIAIGLGPCRRILEIADRFAFAGTSGDRDAIQLRHFPDRFEHAVDRAFITPAGQFRISEELLFALLRRHVGIAFHPDLIGMWRRKPVWG
ncbi:hypothetical protein AJ87_22880 [Rhizobium yanglingense]|nr:hypothetical protein AJ87_22880 [Rhizobium yanglingense]